MKNDRKSMLDAKLAERAQRMTRNEPLRFGPTVKPIKVITPKSPRAPRMSRDDPAYNSPDGPYADVKGTTAVRKVDPSWVPIDPARLLQKAKYGI